MTEDQSRAECGAECAPSHEAFGAGRVDLSTDHANAMPAFTWGKLAMNETSLTIPAGCVTTQATATVAGDAQLVQGADRTFEQALEEAAPSFSHLRRASAPGDAAQRALHGAGSLDVPALSAYQSDAVALEEAYEPARAFKTGMGEEAFQIMRQIAGSAHTIAVAPHGTGKACVRVEGAPGKLAVSALDVVVGEGATFELQIELDGVASEDGAGVAQAQAKTEATEPAKTQPCGVVGTSVRVFAQAGARVDITSYQTADDAFAALDDTGLTLADNARVHVRHVVLGAGHSMTGLAADIPGGAARLEVDTSYLGTGEQIRDFNYAIAHRGQDGESEMNANGVLAKASKKCLRGTIDLVHGCKGSQGTEHETVLLVDERAKNKTVPVILCDEDNVMGNHGATIGHVRPDQLFYLQSRGISPEAAEALFCRAKLEDAAISAPSSQARAAVGRLATRITNEQIDPAFYDEEVLA